MIDYKRVLLAFSLLVTGISFIFVLLKGQDRNWDLLNYHYYTGYALLHGRYLQDVAAANLQTFFNPSANIFAYLSLKYLPFPFSAWSLLVIQLLSFPALVLIAREIGKGMGYVKVSLTEILALVLCILAPLWWSELGTSFFSSTTAPLILWGVYLLLRESSSQITTRYFLIVAGALFGFASGLKLTNGPFAVAGTVSLLYLSYDQGLRHTLVRVSLFVFGGIFGFLITAWWNLYLWNTWGSPLFPLYNAIFKSPFFDLVNWRDMRWHFTSVSDFIVFLVQAASGSGRASEVPFADSRLVIVALLLPGVLLCKPAISLGKQAVAILFFAFSGIALWAITLAYQRYLIPLELLLGIVIWIFVLRLVEKEKIRVLVLTCLLAVSAYMIKIPDWGHAKVDFGTKDPFSIEIPSQFSATPARYIVVGAPISYILPSLHADSVFYGVGFTNQIDKLIAGKITQPSHLPLRVIASDHDSHTLWDRLNDYKYDPITHELNCAYAMTGVGRYIICEIATVQKKPNTTGLIVDADFSESTDLSTKGILWESGLSVPENWGRWSDSELAEIGFANCLPKGKLQIIVTGHAFGPNVGEPVSFVLGEQQVTAVFNQSDSDVSMHFLNKEKCTNSLTIHIPTPKSPMEMGLSADPRKLGLGLVRIKIILE